MEEKVGGVGRRAALPSCRPFEARVRMMAGTVREMEATRGMT